MKIFHFYNRNMRALCNSGLRYRGPIEAQRVCQRCKAKAVKKSKIKKGLIL